MPSPRNADSVDLSVVMAANRNSNVCEALQQYRPVLDGLGRSYEVLCVVESAGNAAIAALTEMARDWPELEIFARRPWGGEDAELGTAFRRSKGKLVLTLPPFLEISPDRLPQLFDRIDEADMVIVNRADQPIGGSQQRLLKGVFGLFFGHTVSDVFSRVRLSRRDVLEEVGGFGVRQHFIPVIAADRGYRVVETTVESNTTPEAASRKFVFRPGGYLSAMFDAMTLYVVLKFLRRPLRFFGAIGMPIFLVGLLLTLGLVIGRLFFDVPLADRPMLIFSVLMIVLGIQIVAIGLVGEIIIFANSRHMKQYNIATIIRRRSEADKVEEVVLHDD